MEVLQHVLQSTQPSGACKIEQKDLSSARPDKEIITSSDMSTQCCVGPRYIITRSASTQAPEAPVVSTPVPVKTFCDIGIQVGPSGNQHETKLDSHTQDDKMKTNSNDTNLGCRAKPIVLVPSDSVKPGPSVLFHYLLAYAHPVGIDHTNKRKRDDSDDDTGNPDCKHKPTVFEEVYPSDEEPSNDPPSSPLTLVDLNDQEYVYEISDNAASSPDNSDAELESEVQNEQKFIVFESCLKVKLTLNLKHVISPKTSQEPLLQANKNLFVNTGPGLTDNVLTKEWVTGRKPQVPAEMLFSVVKFH
ncbi:hypothetical protein OS493_007370 [Desmophyllum pertusum]|uniref:Uncharacterized protein n=1 Tax=Desmophyllum pertusum TaxID=174260 RepID=A0A9W9Z5Q8_9CNID|nr:hypothetical protein OS493_007370 [Desmophyllum pertusum]